MSATLTMLRRSIQQREGRPFTDEQVSAVLDQLTGPRGLDLAAWMLEHTPQSALGDLLIEAFSRPISRDVWQCLLYPAWIQNPARVCGAAGSRETLKSWFGLADFWNGPRLPVVPGLDRGSLPAKGIEVYRGGVGKAGAVAGGYCWSLRLDVASAYTNQRRPGPPVVVKRTVARDQIALYWCHPSKLCVLLAPGPFEVVGDRQLYRRLLISPAALDREVGTWLLRLEGKMVTRKQIERQLAEQARWAEGKRQFDYAAATRGSGLDPALVTLADTADL